MKKSRTKVRAGLAIKRKPKRSSPIRTRTNPIPPASFATVPASKRIRRDGSQRKTGFAPKGASASPARTATFVAESQRQGDRIAREKSLRREYAKFYATAEGREFAKKYGKSFEDDLRLPSEHEKRPPEGDDRRALPEFIPNGTQNRSRPLIGRIDTEHPMHSIEPEAQPSVELEYLSDFEIKASSAIFEALIRWGLNAGSLADKGERTLIFISKLRDDLSAGLELDTAAKKDFEKSFRLPPEGLEATGRVFGRVLEWIRRGSDIVTYGERLYLVAYALRPELIDAATLAKLGAMAGKTRQAKDKSANCLRDTISGIKALAMRGDITRIRCKAAQVRLGLALTDAKAA